MTRGRAPQRPREARRARPQLLLLRGSSSRSSTRVPSQRGVAPRAAARSSYSRCLAALGVTAGEAALCFGRCCSASCGQHFLTAPAGNSRTPSRHRRDIGAFAAPRRWGERNPRIGKRAGLLWKKICTPTLRKKMRQNRKSGFAGASTFFVDRPVRASPRAIRVT